MLVDVCIMFFKHKTGYEMRISDWSSDVCSSDRETLSEADDEIMEKYLEEGEFTVEELEAAIRRATLADKLNPVLLGTAFKNKGVQPLLDAVVKFMPSPLDIDGIQGHAVNDEEEVVVRQPSDNEPFSGLAYEIATDPQDRKS